MCVANLHVAQGCGHRWYELRRACTLDSNLLNCPARLRLEGWETKNEACPFCSSSDPSSPVSAIDESTHRLFAGPTTPVGRKRSTSTTGPSTSPQRGRNDSISTNSLTLSTSRSSSHESDEEARDMDRAERNRLMNRRLEAYISINPASSKQDRLTPTITEAATVCDADSVSRSSSVVGKSWKKSMRLPRNIFRG